MIKIDLHLHSTISDGTDTPEEILQLIRKNRIDVFSITDHDSIDACRRVRQILSDDDPAFINGVEFSCKDDGGKYHILGYGYDPEGEMICSLAEKTHRMRMEKARGRLQVLKEKYGYSFSEDDREKLLSLDNPGKPHIGNLMAQYGYASSKDEAIEKVLNHIHVHTGSITPEEAIRSIKESSGTAILAHPPFGNGSQFITGELLEERVQRLKDLGLDGLETWYSGYDIRLRKELKRIADRYDLLATAGSDYHGSNKTVKIGDTGLADARTDVRVRAFLNRIGLLPFTTG